MTEVKKFNVMDELEEFDNDATEKEVNKSTYTGMIGVGTFTLEVTKAQIHLTEKSAKDPAFYKFVITVVNSAGQTRDIYSQFSFKKFKYGEKNTLIFAVKLKEFFRAMGFPELSLKEADKIQDREILRKYMNCDETGVLHAWEGMKFEGTFAYGKDTFHIEKDNHETKPFVLVDANSQPHVFSELKVFDDVTADYAVIPNSVLRGATLDTVKSEAGINGVANKLSMSELKFLKPIPGANTQLLSRLQTPSAVKIDVKPNASVDPQSLVTTGKSNDEFPL